MALTGKTISELNYLSAATSNTLFPVELSGLTYYVPYSGMTGIVGGNTPISITYDELYSLYTGGTLSAGRLYLITDFQTCYDQPNYDSQGTPITTGNFKSGNTEQIVVLATASNKLSPQAYSLDYPDDILKYDITFRFTEVTNTRAKGRITERIDRFNNRTDYDFRAVQFIRYVGYFSERFYDGKITLTSSNGLVTGTTTLFLSNFSNGDIFGVYYPYGATLSCFKYYEITSIVSDTEMYVTGRTLTDISNTYFSRGLTLPNYSSPFQNNVTGGTNDDFAEYYTFDENSYGTYIGNNSDYYVFILSNNVFKAGNYYNNIFGENSICNTLDDDMDSNTFGPFSSFNILTNDFDRNTVGPFFESNIIDCDMEGNIIGERFSFNMIGDADGPDFDYNRIGFGYRYNFLTLNNNSFSNNDIGYNFSSNIIDSGFRNNVVVGDFTLNVIVYNDFNDNFIGNNFYNNNIPVGFSNNNIGGQFYDNNIWSVFNDNTLGENVFTNNFGNPNSIGTYQFNGNKIGGDFGNNYFSGNTQFNTIGFSCTTNHVDNNFSYNQIGYGFYNNTIANDFGFGGGNYRGNIIGNGFVSNVIGEYCYDNTFGDECASNNLGNYFTNNKISHSFNNVTTVDLDTSGYFQNNNFTYGFFNVNLTLTGGTGGNPIFYTQITTNVVKDSVDNTGYVTFLSGGTIVARTIIV